MARARRKVLVVLGTRPEAIKLAPVVRALARRGLAVRLCSTGQHRGLLERALNDLGLRPHRELRLMRRDQSPADFCARALAALAAILRAERPAMTLVQGDTTSALAGALASAYAGVPVGHVEAGLRSFDPFHPFPEELNRALIDRLSVMHFAPTPGARRNLLAEGAPASGILVTGNTAVDALRSLTPERLRPKTPRLRRALAGLAPGDVPVLVTLHRRETHGPALAALCRGLLAAVSRRPELRLFLPVHLNPRVERPVRALLRHPRVELLPPLGHGELIGLVKRCRFVMTDSGGLQEEAPSLGRPVLILREKTERPEAIEAGAARLIGTAPDAVARWAKRLLTDRALYRSMSRRTSVFGDGKASERIARALAERLKP